MDLAGEQSSTSAVCERRDAILQHMFTRMLSSLSASFAARSMCRSDKSPGKVYGVTGSTFTSVV